MIKYMFQNDFENDESDFIHFRITSIHTLAKLHKDQPTKIKCNKEKNKSLNQKFIF